MRRIWLAVLVAIFLGIGIVIPMLAQASGPYGRNGWDEWGNYTPPTAPYSSRDSDRRYIREEYRAYRSPDEYDGAETPHYSRSVILKKRVICTSCPAPEPAKVTQKVTVNNYYPPKPAVTSAPKPKKVKPCRIADPCPAELDRLKVELLMKERELDKARESARTTSLERQRLADENAKWQALERSDREWKSQYREWYPEFQAWKARRNQ